MLGVNNLTYEADKCLYEQQGERIALERWPLWVEEVWDWDNKQYQTLLKSPDDTPREVNQIETLKWYLTFYHSDYRWLVKKYKGKYNKFKYI